MPDMKIQQKNEKTSLIKYTGKEKELFLPDTIHVIDQAAFCKCDTLEVVHIPSSVKTIKTEAFYGCQSLREIHFAEGLLEIHHRSFWFCNNLTEVIFPKSLKMIGSRAFECCGKLASVKLQNEGAFVNEYAFNETPYWHNALKKAALCSPRNYKGTPPGELRLPEGVTHIDIWAYAGSGIESAYLPNSLRTMGMSAFKDCKSLKEISLTPNVYCNYNMPLGAGDGIFSGCTKLEQITIRGKLTNFIWDKATEPEFLKGFDPERTFTGCNNLKRIIAWEIPLSKIPSGWQRYAINGYISDLNRDKHYPPAIREEYERRTTSMKEQLLRKTQFDKSFALYEYLMARRFVTEENFDSLFHQAVAAECTDIAAALLEYKHTCLTKSDEIDSLFADFHEL
ncbi:MAG: leucine-rich repeat domain-containing protein [Lachnospiraceae bacterium]|nr:leucine-rich repeat domain-containing protein [Lachnospiraceae bacterium]